MRDPFLMAIATVAQGLTFHRRDPADASSKIYPQIAPVLGDGQIEILRAIPRGCPRINAYATELPRDFLFLNIQRQGQCAYLVVFARDQEVSVFTEIITTKLRQYSEVSVKSL